jgi:hypothetical protein
MMCLPSFDLCQRLLALAIVGLILHINLSPLLETVHYFTANASRFARFYGPVSLQIMFRGLLVLKDLFALHLVLGRVAGFVRTRLPLCRWIGRA